MQYKLAVFDLDGTILDTLADLAEAVNNALRKNRMPEHTTEEVRWYVGNGIPKLIARAVPEDADETQRQQVHADFTAYYKEHCADHTAPYPGIPEMLCALRAAGMQTAVVSNKADYAVQILVEDYFPGLFDAAVGDREGFRRKPAPDSVNAVLETLGIDRGEAVYIGDSDVDIATAKNAGMPCISVDWGFRPEAFLREHGAEIILHDAGALQDFLLNVN